MASGLESQPVFAARAAQMGIPAGVIALLAAGNIATLGQFAFCCRFQPGGSDEKPFTDVLEVVLGGPPTLGLLSSLRRLYYEAHTTSLIEMRSRLERTDDDGPKKIQGPERTARMVQLKARLPGLSITGELEFSHALFDRVMDQADRNELRYILLEDCTRRHQELEGIKKDELLKIEVKRDNSLKMSAEQVAPKARLATDLEIRNAFLRRALAYDAGSLITFGVHEVWIAKLFRIMSEPAIEDHQQISMQQALRADRRLWTKLAEANNGSIVQMPGGLRPLDAAMTRLMDDVEVTFLMLPLPAHHKSSASASTSLLDTAMNWPQNTRPGPYEGGKHKGKKGDVKGKGKGGKSDGKGKGPKTSKVSSSGCSFNLQDGKPVCIFFNSPGGCHDKKVAVGKRCSRGWHLCGKNMCGGEHAMPDCNKH